MKARHAALVSAAIAAAVALSAAAQTPPLDLPQPSQKASVTQTVGLTDIAISYHRPAVNKRKIWGGLVPYGEPWRAGANENTTISFGSPVKVNGKELAAGTYGLHMIPTEKEWTIAFSKQAHAWGSFSYDAKEDALRVTATPEPGDFHERLEYTFDEPTNTATGVSLRWEKLRVPFRVEVDTPSVVVASLRDQMRGLPRFSWQGWNQAANYCAQNGVNLDEANKWADASIAINPTFANLRTKALLVEKKGDAKQAGELRARAMTVATEQDINVYGYNLLGQGKTDEAIEVFRKNVKDHPASWNVYDSLGEAQAAKGDKASAKANYEKARSLVKDDANRKRIDGILAKLAS
jgi:tetratricopeptide (TPR) repeat protein